MRGVNVFKEAFLRNTETAPLTAETILTAHTGNGGVRSDCLRVSIKTLDLFVLSCRYGD